MSIFGKCLALRTTTVILCATGWYDRDTWSSPLLMHFCKGETSDEKPGGQQGRRKSLQEGVLRGTEGRAEGHGRVCIQARYRSMGSQPEFSKLHWLIQM